MGGDIKNKILILYRRVGDFPPKYLECFIAFLAFKDYPNNSCSLEIILETWEKEKEEKEEEKQEKGVGEKEEKTNVNFKTAYNPSILE